MYWNFLKSVGIISRKWTFL